MDPSKTIGKLKEQVAMEHLARRNYPKKWQKLNEAQLQKVYNQNALNELLKEQLKMQDLCPFNYTAEGESYFVSKDMYDSLLAHCRCGRERKQTHILRCLQTAQNDCLMKAAAREAIAANKTLATKTDVEVKSEKQITLPRTSNAFVGYQKRSADYKQWEQSMKYISPVYTMPGQKITSTSYNAIIIG